MTKPRRGSGGFLRCRGRVGAGCSAWRGYSEEVSDALQAHTREGGTALSFKSTVGIVDIEAMLSGRLRRHLSAFAAGGGNAESAPVRVVEILLILAGGTALVYATGGTKFVWPHVMYFAVVLAGVTFGRRVGVLVGVVAGLLMGPVMPLGKRPIEWCK